MSNHVISPYSEKATYIKLSLVAIIWGGTFVAGRYISTEVPPLLAASLRFMIASITLTLFLIFFGNGFKKINRIQALVIIALGFCGIYAYNMFFFYGLQYTNASRASLIVASNPAVMAIFSYLFYREKSTPIKLMGITLCLLGATAVILSKSPHVLQGSLNSGLGDGLIFGCVLSWVAYSIFCKNIVKEIGPLHTVTYSIYAGAAMLSITAIMTGQVNDLALSKLSVSSMISLLYLGMIGSALAYIWYYDGIQKIGATRSGVFIALNPLTAVLLGSVLLGEQLSPPIFIGGVLIIIGIFLCNKQAAAQTIKNKLLSAKSLTEHPITGKTFKN